MNYIKAFMAGITLPSIILPILFCIALLSGKSQVLNLPFLHFIPLVWGIWNILYIAFSKKVFGGNVNTRLLLTGAILGLLVASYGIFCANIPKVLGISRAFRYLPLIIGPVLYAVLWRFVVKPLNNLVGVREE